MSKSKYSIEKTLNYEHADEGPWRSYEFSTYGDNLEELINNATVSEIDQDGGEMSTDGIDDNCSQVASECYELIEKELISGGRKDSNSIASFLNHIEKEGA